MSAVAAVMRFTKALLELPLSLKGMPYRRNALCLLDNPNGDDVIRRARYRWTGDDWDRTGQAADP